MLRLSIMCLILLFVTGLARGQSDTLIKRLAEASCKCSEKVNTPKDKKTFSDCIVSVLHDNTDPMLEDYLRLNNHDSTNKEMVQKFSNQVFEDILVSLVYECYDYFTFMDSYYSSESESPALSKPKADSLKTQIASLSIGGKISDSSIFYTVRGVLKLQLKDTSGANQDLDKAVIFKPSNLSARLARGWTLQANKDYARAINDIQYLADVTGDYSYRIIVAIMNRKAMMATEIKK